MTHRPTPGNTAFVAARHARGWYSQAELAAAFEQKARDLGVRLDVSVRQVRRWESGNPPWPNPEYQTVLQALFEMDLTVLGFTPPYGTAVQAEAVQNVRAVKHAGWWRAIVDDLPDHTERLVALEAQAVGVRSYQTTLIPGPLQTFEYAVAAIKSTGPALSDDAVQQRAQLRIERQRRFAPAPDRPVWFVVDESALSRTLGSPNMLRHQLGHLLTIASQRPELRMQVLPVDGEIAIPGPFVIYEMPAPSRRVVFLESLGDALCTDTVEVVAQYSYAYEALQAAALPPASSLEFISRRLAELWEPSESSSSQDGGSPNTPVTPDAWRWEPEPQP